MKKFMSVLCLLAILCVAALTLTQLYNGEKTAAEDIETGAEELVGQMKNMYEEYGSAAVAQADEKLNDVVAQADEKLGDVVEQADEAIGDAVESAKEGFWESIKESIRNFFRDLTS